ncbi:MAG: efflux RND transporter periplasmic adaptor subunit [Acidobacteriota bacterium]
MKKVLIRFVILAALVGAAWASYRFVQQLPQRQVQVATTKVRQGDIIVKTFARGELRAVRSATLTAPNLFGTVQVTKLAEIGSFAREKDLVIEFDDAELLSRLEEKQLEIDQIDEQYKKSQADLAIRNNSDQVELLRARYAVRRSELEVKRNELLSPIDAKRNELNLEEAKRRLKQLESDIKSRQEQAEAELAVLQERRRKSVLELAREKSRLTQVKILAPMSGLVAVRQNQSSRMGFGFDVPDIREGDQVQPGMPIADVLDLSELEVLGRVGELDRANLSEGQDVLLGLDAISGKQFHGKIKSMSSTASANVSSSDPAKKFDVVFSIDRKELLTSLGAKPEQVAKILATAEANRNRPPVPSFGGMAAMMMGQGGMGGGMGQGGMSQGGMGQGAGAGAAAGGGGGRFSLGMGGPWTGAGAGGSATGGISHQDRQKMREAIQKALNGRSMQDLTAEERTKLMADVAKQTGISRPAGAGAGAGGADAAAAGAGEGRRRRNGGDGADAGMAAMAAARPGRFSEADFKNAKLPPPPDQDSQLDVLLRPGLLADIEIIVEKIPNAVNIPAQAVFEDDGKLVVYVKSGERFEPRSIKPLKRSDSTLIIAEGLKKDEVIALTNPTAKPGAKKEKGGSGGGPMNALPGGKS